MDAAWIRSQISRGKGQSGYSGSDRPRLRSQGNYIPGSLQQACCVVLSQVSICPGDLIPQLSSRRCVGWDENIRKHIVQCLGLTS